MAVHKLVYDKDSCKANFSSLIELVYYLTLFYQTEFPSGQFFDVFLIGPQIADLASQPFILLPELHINPFDFPQFPSQTVDLQESLIPEKGEENHHRYFQPDLYLIFQKILGRWAWIDNFGQTCLSEKITPRIKNDYRVF